MCKTEERASATNTRPASVSSPRLAFGLVYGELQGKTGTDPLKGEELRVARNGSFYLFAIPSGDNRLFCFIARARGNPQNHFPVLQLFSRYLSNLKRLSSCSSSFHLRKYFSGVPTVPYCRPSESLPAKTNCTVLKNL